MGGSSVEEVQKKKGPLDGIRQFFVNCDREDFKIDTLLDLIDYITMKKTKTVIFANTKGKVTWLADRLKEEKGLIVTEINRGMGKTERKEKMMKFLTDRKKILLISTDPAYLDVGQVSLVINFDLPAKREDYGRRIRRLGMFRMERIAINFVTRNDIRQLNDLQDFYETKIEELPSDIADLI